MERRDRVMIAAILNIMLFTYFLGLTLSPQLHAFKFGRIVMTIKTLPHHEDLDSTSLENSASNEHKEYCELHGEIEIEWFPNSIGRIERIIVAPEVRRNGLGSSLFNVGTYILINHANTEQVFWTAEPIAGPAQLTRQNLRRFYEQSGGALVPEDATSYDDMHLKESKLAEIRSSQLSLTINGGLPFSVKACLSAYSLVEPTRKLYSYEIGITNKASQFLNAVDAILGRLGKIENSLS